MSGCAFAGCERPGHAKGLCKTHYNQQCRGERLQPIKPRPPRKRLSDETLDLALLLIACGAKTDDAAGQLGVSVKQLRTQLRAECRQAWRDADRARAMSPHGTQARYKAGCRCFDCRGSKRDAYWKAMGRPQAEPERFVGRRDEQQVKLRDRFLVTDAQRRTLERASNYGKEWTGPEIEIAMRDDLTHAQRAELLGRSLYAVRHIVRKVNRGDPKSVNLLGRTTRL